MDRKALAYSAGLLISLIIVSVLLNQGIILAILNPGDIVILSAADTELAGLAQARPGLDGDVPTLRLANLMQLGHNMSVDLYVDGVVAGARLAATFPQLARHPQWIENAEVNPLRGRWLVTLRQWGFIQ